MFFTLVLLGALYISTVNGWGATGHALVAKIAQNTLTQEAQKFVQDHLPWYAKGDLSMLASWPDTILYPDTNPVEYLNWQWSKELHYVNTPDWSCNYDRNRDCDWAGSQRCVDGSIQNYTNRLADTSLDSTQRQEALRFLVHFIGDVHQPLHAGFTSDRGGNSIKGQFFGKATNLHSLWDTVMIERRISTDFQSDSSKYLAYLLNVMHTTYIRNISQWTKCPSNDESKYLACSTAWIDENSELNCDHVYRNEQDQRMTISQQFKLSDIYFNTRMVFVEARLLQGGVRLGAVINKVVQLQKHHHSKKGHDQLCTGTMLLMAVILLQVVLAFLIVIYVAARRRNYRRPLAQTPGVFHSAKA
ncbi:unnamed protein product [Adineta ricciae]|uniref:Aspergillus nuclease S(1) n=1 Tax=Adineta ricciae TaxID=249248 RepID=A0A814SZ10_ADIRI|nr:unnamed protein product [Adineta ricciae]CAF1154043.1 unnamed protein product [Adineta ricciae]